MVLSTEFTMDALRVKEAAGFVCSSLRCQAYRAAAACSRYTNSPAELLGEAHAM
jgi:hypothetical protein